MSFADKVVIITGAASGIGNAIAKNFAKLNANLCIVDVNERRLLKVKKECEEFGKIKVLEVVADLRKDEDVENLVGMALKEFGKIDVLVNCAAIVRLGNIEDPDIVGKFDEVMAVNLRASLIVTKHALPALKKSKGCIINISSVGTTVILKNMLVYNMSKAGITNFTKCIALELARKGVRVNCISPGIVKTNILLNAGVSEVDDEKIFDGLIANLPINKFVKAEEIAEMAVFLASDKAASITGSNFVVDGGMQLGTVENAEKIPYVCTE